MFINLHSHVLAKLAAREVPWTQVARDTGIPYETLKKIASGRTPNPGVLHVQTLADYFNAGLAGAQAIPPGPAKVKVGKVREAIESVAKEAHAAILQVKDEAMGVLKHEAETAEAEIKHVAEALLKDDESWDGATDRRKADALWDGKTERRKLDAPIDRRVSPESVAHAQFLRSQSAAKQQGL